MKALRSMNGAIRDLATQKLPHRSNPTDYRFAFLVHPRNRKDISRKYPIFDILPNWFIDQFALFFWPVILSRVTGLRSHKSGQELTGYVMTIPMTAHQMIEHRSLALKRILEACTLAERKGVKILGLGALTSSVTKGGLDLVNKTTVNITTGHAYTAYNVTQNVFHIISHYDLPVEKITVAIVGAAGSVGSTSAKLIARKGIRKILLIDLERKHGSFEALRQELLSLNPNIEIVFSKHIGDIKEAHFVIAATNAPEALIKNEDLSPGTIVVDDAQPSDVAPEVLDRHDVLAIEAGVTHTPHVNSHFNFGLKDKHDNFCCMAEVLILASQEWNEHYVINRATLDLVDEISALGEKLGFHIGAFQNFKEIIKKDKIDLVVSTLKHKLNGL